MTAAEIEAEISLCITCITNIANALSNVKDATTHEQLMAALTLQAWSARLQSATSDKILAS